MKEAKFIQLTISLRIRSFSILSCSFFCSLSVFACHVSTALLTLPILPETFRWYSLNSFTCCSTALKYSCCEQIILFHGRFLTLVQVNKCDHLMMSITPCRTVSRSRLIRFLASPKPHKIKVSAFVPDVSVAVFSPVQFSVVSQVSPLFLPL